MAQVVANAAATFHELHLLLVNAHYAAVGIGMAVETDYETVAQRHRLHVVADAGHGTPLRHYVSEIFEQVKDFVMAHGVGVLVLYAGQLGGDTVVHIVGSQLIENALRVLQRIFTGPHPGGQFIAIKILYRGVIGLVVRKSLFIFH